MTVANSAPAPTAPRGRVIASQDTGGPLGADAYRPVRDFLAGPRRLWLPLHVSPDGDCLGCSLALAHMLNGQGYDCTVVSSDPIPTVYSCFLPAAAQGTLDRVFVGATPPGPPPDAIVVLDCSDPIRLGNVYTANRALFDRLPLLNVDHHSTNFRFGDLNILDTTAAAAAEQVACLLDALDLPPDPAAATWLLLGLTTDTLGFRTSGTTARSLRIGADLMDRGGQLFPIVEQVFNTRPLSTVLLWSKALAGVQTDGRTIWISATRQMLQDAGAKEEELEGLVSWLAGVESIKIAALLKERGDGTRVSLRSRPGVNVATVAARFGGGGHPQAAGCTIPAIGEAAAQALLAAIDATLDAGSNGSEPGADSRSPAP